MKRTMVALMIVLIAGLLSACGVSSTPTAAAPTVPPTATQGADPVPAALVGSYTKLLTVADIRPFAVGVWTLIIRADGRYELTSHTQMPGLTGYFELHGSKITFMEDQCGGEPTYTWSLNGDKLVFVDVSSDTCGGRAALLSHGAAWTKLASS